MEDPSRRSWTCVWSSLGLRAAEDDPLYLRLVAAYSEPHRKYHTLQHLSECLRWLDSVPDLAEHPGEVEIALWFHDAVYAFERQDNEERSAEWARSALLERGVAAVVADRVFGLVMATRHATAPDSMDDRLLVDVDLAILGAAPERFEEYEGQIRAEYSWVPEELFRQKRRQVLEGFLARPFVYGTEFFRDLLEEPARRNLQQSITRLGGG
jgi:predicted metal-dependent HD superfamily phosphohydrolase